MVGEVIELNVCVDCPGCQRKIKQKLNNMKEVSNAEVDIKTGIAKVTIGVHVKDEDKLKKKLLKVVREKAGKSAELVVPASMSGYNPFVKPSEKFQKTYNYYEQGYNVLPPSVIPNPNTQFLDAYMYLNDDNVKSCSIM